MINPTPMSKLTSLLPLTIVLFLSCNKSIDQNQGPSTPQFAKYTISGGNHYADHNPYKPVQYDELQFTVKFDSSSIYQTIDPENQEDINKLYGFSDNNEQHQRSSERVGWNWTRSALRLYAYTYNNGVRDSKEISSIPIGVEQTCSIKVQGNKYIFTVGHIIVEMHRESITSNAIGYKLYPYFGGDEVAPHEITIWIKE
jgi:hypothetical protein